MNLPKQEQDEMLNGLQQPGSVFVSKKTIQLDELPIRYRKEAMRNRPSGCFMVLGCVAA